jgi:hypothetical protein
MKRRNLLFLILITGALAGCAGSSRVVTDAVGGGVGAYVANKLSNGNPLITAAGGAGGVLLGETLNYASDKSSKKAYTEGFDKGRSDAVKQQYWVMVNQKKAAEDHELDQHINLYEIPVPEQQIDGVTLKPTTKLLRIEE